MTRILFYITSPILWCSCVNNKVDQQLLTHQGTQRSVIANFENSITQSRQKSITWRTAVRQIESSNLRYLSSVDRVEKSFSAKKRTWWTLAPEIFTFVNISKSLTEISDINSDDISFSILANITIPNPFRFYAQLYADYLGMINAQWQHELNKRKFQVELYSFFTRQHDIDKEQLKLNKVEQSLAHTNLDQFEDILQSYEAKKITLQSQSEYLRVQLNELFNTPGKNWRLKGDPPNISYADKLGSLSLEQGYGKLGLMLQTLEIESNIVTLWNVKVGRWPQLSIGLSNPPLVSSSSGARTEFDPEQTRLFTGTSHGIKINDPLNSERMRDAEKRSRYTKEQLLLATENDASRIFLIKKRYSHLIRRHSQLQQSLATKKSDIKKTSNPTLLLEAMKDTDSLVELIEANKRQQLQFDLQLWIWDENYWQTYL